jgi:hypothetical protein
LAVVIQNLRPVPTKSGFGEDYDVDVLHELHCEKPSDSDGRGITALSWIELPTKNVNARRLSKFFHIHMIFIVYPCPLQTRCSAYLVRILIRDQCASCLVRLPLDSFADPKNFRRVVFAVSCIWDRVYLFRRRSCFVSFRWVVSCHPRTVRRSVVFFPERAKSVNRGQIIGYR